MTEQRLSHLQRRCELLPETAAVFAEWKRLAAAHSVVGKAAHDARLVAQMLVSQIPMMLTFNTSDFRRYRGITALTPGEIAARPTPHDSSPFCTPEVASSVFRGF